LAHLVLQEVDGKCSYEIVVVNDLSSDSTAEVVAEIMASSPIRIRYILGDGQGIASARNLGISGSFGEWIAFVDDDEFADPNWLNELVVFAKKTGRDVVGGAVLLDLSDSETSEIAPVCRLMLGESVGRNKPEKYTRRFSPGCNNLLVHGSVFDAVGRFDESLTRGGEDVDFWMRVRGVGIEAWFTPQAVVRHYVPTYRLDETYLFWVSSRWGSLGACRDYKEWGLVRTQLMCMAKMIQACLINIPLLISGLLLGNKAAVVARECLLLRAIGYARQSLFLLSPRIFTQARYFAGLTFRSERGMFAPEVNPARR
jgi:GT2 family glycosyltransferase